MADEGDARDAGRRQGKSAAAFRTISEVATDLDVPPHVLRFWESKFTHVKPLKRGGGRRYYRPEDIELLRGIRELLYTDGYTIKGVQKLLRDGGVKSVLNGVAEPDAGDADAAPRVEAPAPKAAAGTAVPEPATAAADRPDAPPAPSLAPGKRAALREVLAELEDIRELLGA